MPGVHYDQHVLLLALDLQQALGTRSAALVELAARQPHARFVAQ